jgi:hypothetical protein
VIYKVINSPFLVKRLEADQFGRRIEGVLNLFLVPK